MANGALTAHARPLLGAGLLLAAATLWGIGFYAQRISVTVLPPLTATALRFLLTLPLVAGALLWCRQRGPLPWRAGFVLGVLMYLVFALQAVAMLHTPVTRVALLAGLYAALTPILQPLFKLGRPTRMQLVAAACACVGTALLCGVVGNARALSAPPNIGDALTLVAALLSAICVLLVGWLSPKHNPIALNAVQIASMALLSLVVAPIFETMPELSTLPPSSWWSFLYLALFSTIAAFLLQLIGQRHLSPTPATSVLLLETPVGVVAALVLLGEVMGGLQWVGGVFAILAVLLAVRGERRET